AQPQCHRNFGGCHSLGGRMGSPASRIGMVAPILVSSWMLLAAPTFGQQEPPQQAASPSLDLGGMPSATAIFDGGQEPPATPSLPAPGPDTYPLRPLQSRFLFGDGFGLRPLLEERGLAVYVSSTQFEPGVASGGAR